MKTTFLKFFLFILFTQNTYAQCFEIESILVDACGAQEGLNEMVRFKVGTNPLNTSTLNVSWPNNSWQGLIQNATTASKVATLNADVINAGGCGELIEPIGGVLPANATVILVTSFNFDTALNAFGALSEDIYIIFQNNVATTAGHFANFGTGLRTLTISIGSCVDVVTYDRALLVSPTGQNTAADGATVLFDPAGNATYVNYGCLAPVQPFLVEINNPSSSVCPGDVIALSGVAEGHQSVLWTAPGGVFSNPGGLTTSYTIPTNATGTITLTLTAVNSCGLEISDTIILTISANVVPDFITTLTLCNGDAAPALNTTSPNGITGIWSPSVINNTTNGNYIFTPDTNQCATSVVLAVTVTNSIVPDFDTTLTLCSGTTAPVLNTTSPNGITGTWSPSTINNTSSGSYTFTPNPNQCGTPITLAVTVTDTIVPDFDTTLTFCSETSVPALNTTSPNGITGTWSPSVIDNSTSGNYVFTPDPNQCGSPITLAVTIINSVVPDFDTTLTLCNGEAAPALNSTSPNGINGTWSPSVINNTSSGNYVFTPNPNQCSSPVTLAVTVTTTIVPDFDTVLTLCSGTTAPTLNTISPNGINGTWSPSAIDNSTNGNYIFTPDPDQCASSVTLAVTVTDTIVPDFDTTLTFCSNAAVPALNTTSPNGITGTWNPSAISNITSGNYVFTPDPNQCGSPITLAVTIINSVVPDFDTALTLCNGEAAPALNSTSPNGINGTWSPSAINNTSSGNYVFTPNPNQCSSPVTLAVTVTTTIVPDFDTVLILCSGTTAPTLNTISPNGIAGTWSPSTIDNSTSGNYVFTPDSNQCASSVTLTVTVTDTIVPDFDTALTFCSNAAVPALNTISPNGITGTWSPSAISNITSGNYVFTPDPNQCGSSVTLTVNITDFGFTFNEKCEGRNFIIEAVFEDSLPGSNYEWTLENSSSILSEESFLNVTELLNSSNFTATFPITFFLKIYTDQGCEKTNSITIYNAFCGIPKGISPNNDGLNDSFDLAGLGVEHISIFNRYGRKVYSKNNYIDEWHGQSDNGHELPDGTYYFLLNQSDGKQISGWVYLIR